MPITISNKNETQKQPESESFNPRRIAARPRKCCHRCGKPVPKGALIERIPHPTKKGYTWIHAHCDAEGYVPPAEAPNDNLDEVLENLESLRDQVEELKAAAPKRIEIKVADRDPVDVEGLAHPALEEVAELIIAGEAVFLPGPSGCGKSHLAEQVAKSLDYRFASISCTAGMSESQLLGRALPTGKQGQFTYCSTPFLDCYENGGLFLFDEIDAADPNVLLVINSALANGFLSVPARHENPVAKKHADFRCIAAANTFGKGADRQYCGRNPIDEATLDRFRIGTVPVDYNPELERQLWNATAADGHRDILEAMWHYREAIANNRLERTMSTRFIIAAARATTRGRGMEYIDAKFFAGWRDDEIRKVKGA